MSGKAVHSEGLPEKARPLVEYLESRARTEGTFYVKSRVVAAEVTSSAP